MSGSIGCFGNPILISEIASSNNGVKLNTLKRFSELRDQMYRPAPKYHN